MPFRFVLRNELNTRGAKTLKTYEHSKVIQGRCLSQHYLYRYTMMHHVPSRWLMVSERGLVVRTPPPSPPRPMCVVMAFPQVYQSVIFKERKGEYLGKTVQVVPHITDEIQVSRAELIFRRPAILVSKHKGRALMKRVFIARRRRFCSV